MRTIEELETKMRARGLSMQVFGTADACIVVWLYAADAQTNFCTANLAAANAPRSPTQSNPGFFKLNLQ